ncbi:MAG TPA: hypothetical protein VIE43_16060 [Thermoanaerobaculia bacterium]|jgi:hypothetical protein|nr:hypothetical protein [Thermoanaerobaculia bacterium]
MTWKGTLLLGAILVPLALAARWTGNAELKGARFSPAPDTVEYAAEAQSLARTGQIFLQIGPYRVRPRFPPGWPLLIAPAIRLGVQGRDLWRVTAIFGALVAWLLGAVAAGLTARVSPLPPGGWGSEGASFLAGLLAGGVWALAPLNVDLGNTLMSDEPTALFCLAGLLLSGLAFLRREGRGAWAFALTGGIALGLAASMRSIVAVLMLLPLAFFLAGGLRRIGVRAVFRRALLWALGAAIFPAVTLLILARSGWPVWQWSGYGFWMPNRFDHLSSTFNLQYALQPDLTFRQEHRPLSHLDLTLRVILGLPGLRPTHYLGYLWPLAGWLAAIPVYRWARRRYPELTACAAPALLLWTLAHVIIFSLYFYPSPRFYMEPLALCLVLLATACGVTLARPGRWTRLTGAAGMVAVALLAAQGVVDLQNEPLPNLDNERTRAHFHRWLEIGDERRSRRMMPFDPVYAQALGLLTPEVAAGIHAWGELPDTVHVRRLRANGTVPPGPVPQIEPPPPVR